MPTIIRRSPAMGDTRLLRRPFDEPGLQPRSRLSSLNFQGNHGAVAANLVDAGSSTALLDNSGANPPLYQVGADGVPAYRFNQPNDADLSSSMSVRRDNTGVKIRTLICIAKFYDLPSSAAGGSPSYSWLVRPASGGSYGIGIASTNSQYNPGRILGLNGPNASTIVGPQMPIDGKWHFFGISYLYNGNNFRSRLYFDGLQWEETSTTDFVSGSSFITGYDSSGGRYAIAEACAYTEAFTQAEMAKKREHYQNLYQFD